MRKIVIDEQIYHWHFGRGSASKVPHLTIIHLINQKKICWLLNFKLLDHFLLNDCMPAVYEGDNIAINLNQPKFIAQIIFYLQQHNQNKQTEHFDGIEILSKLGYQIDPLFIPPS
ncbi:MAG: hypothetical protein Q4B95_00295 [Lonepinella koalarum]|nr:hypothetical protein [Lonepinella koalarum]